MAAVYFLTARLGFSATLPGLSLSPLWPPTGLALAGLLLLGYRLWPGILVGAFLAGLDTPELGSATAIRTALAAAGIALGSTVAALSGAFLIERFARGRAAFEQPATIFRFVVLGAVLSTAIHPAFELASLWLAGVPDWSNWAPRWLDDMVSVIVLTPLCVVWATKRLPRLDAGRWFELASLLLLLALVSDFLFGRSVLAARHAPLALLLGPLLLWPALRFGQRGTSATVFILAFFAIVGTLQGSGPFAANELGVHRSLLLVQEFTGMVAVMALVLAADVTQYQRVDTALRDSEQRYRQLFECNPQPMWVYDEETLRFLAVNIAAIHHYGYSRQEFMAMRLTDIRPQDDVPGLLQAVTRARQGIRVPAPGRHLKKDGTLIDVEVIRHTMRFGGRPAGMALCLDVTERNKAEKRATAFSELGRRLSGAASAREAAVIIAETADGLFGWDACVFETCSPEQDKVGTILCMDTIDGQRRDVTAQHVHTEPTRHARQIMREGSKLILRQQAAFPEEIRPFGDTSRPSASLMCVPVRNEDKILGLLSVQSYLPNAYTTEDLSGLQALADHCGGALARIAARQELDHLVSELEGRVRERTAQLEAMNQEMEHFSYSVSHDLRAPLRSIRGFSEVLLDRYAPQLEDRAQGFLKRVCASSASMERLIDDLLKFSQSGRSDVQPQPVNLSALAHAIMAELLSNDPQRRVQFSISPDLNAEGDERLLRIVLDNLLRNAWKFTAKQPVGRIEFGALEAPEPAFFVRDNGAGFDPAHTDKLFGAFQRLHTSSEFPGFGVGLATVRRIILRHGGRVWANGAIGHGATFYFSLGRKGKEHCPTGQTNLTHRTGQTAQTSGSAK